MRIGTRVKAVVQPVSLPSSQTRNVGKATWFSGVSPGVLGVWALLASGLLFRFCFWVSSRRVLLALVGRLSSSPGFVSKKRQRPRAPTQGPGFPTGRPRAERALRGGRERGATTRGPVFWQVPLSTYIITAVLVVAPVYLLWSFFPHVCSTHRRGLVEEPPRVERALRGGCSFFFSSSPTVIMATVTTTTYAVVLRLWLRGVLLLLYFSHFSYRPLPCSYVSPSFAPVADVCVVTVVVMRCVELIGAVTTRNAVRQSRLSSSLAHESDHVVFGTVRGETLRLWYVPIESYCPPANVVSPFKRAAGDDVSPHSSRVHETFHILRGRSW